MSEVHNSKDDEMLWAPWQDGNGDARSLQLTRFLEHVALEYPSFRIEAKNWNDSQPASNQSSLVIQAALSSKSPAALQHALVDELCRAFREHDAKACQSLYALVHAWSVGYIADFWTAMWRTSGLTSTQPPPPPGSFVERMDKKKSNSSDKNDSNCELSMFPGAKWFPGVTLNIAENMLAYRDDRPAITSTNEDGETVTTTYKQLHSRVACVAAALRTHSVCKGDFVCAIVKNDVEAVSLMLAVTSIGAVWSSCPPDFGPASIASRFEQIRPRVLLAVTSYRYGGVDVSIQQTVKQVEDRLRAAMSQEQKPRNKSNTNPTQLSVIILSDENGPNKAHKSTSQRSTWIPLKSLLGTTSTMMSEDGANDTVVVPKFTFEPMSLADDVLVMFTSGTTGKPKCLVQGAGVLLNHVKELRLHCNISRQDNVFFMTSTGWMMWNWVVSALALGAQVTLHSGNPLYPTPHSIWNLLADKHITVFGTSAKFLNCARMLFNSPEKTIEGCCTTTANAPSMNLNAPSLRMVLSTGSAASPAVFRFASHGIVPAPRVLQFCSISGGTDINGCFALGCPWLPVYAGELQCIGLGMDVCVASSDGSKVGLIGQRGELVCKQPIPSMPVRLLGDNPKTMKKYRRAYFRFPLPTPSNAGSLSYPVSNSNFSSSMWWHGDLAVHTERGGLLVLGRSDATLNPGGVRIGAAEIDQVLEGFAHIKDSLVVSVQNQVDDDSDIWLFVVLRELQTDGNDKAPAVLDFNLQFKIREHVANELSVAHAPAKIIACPALPYTSSGKKAEVAVMKILNGREESDTQKRLSLYSGLKDASVLEFFRQFSLTSKRQTETNIKEAAGDGPIDQLQFESPPQHEQQRDQPTKADRMLQPTSNVPSEQQQQKHQQQLQLQLQLQKHQQQHGLTIFPPTANPVSPMASQVAAGGSIKIHPTAVVDRQAMIGPGCVIGPFCVIGPLVRMGKRNVVRPHTVIVGATTIGDDNQFSSHCVIGEDAENYTVLLPEIEGNQTCTNPSHHGQSCDSKWDACTYEPNKTSNTPGILIGHRNVFREFVNVHQPEGEAPMYGTTVIGNDCYLMSYSHVAHDNVLQDKVTLACGVVLGGYTRILHNANVGLNTTVHQFSTIGAFAMVAMGTVVDCDVLPFTLFSSRNGGEGRGARSEGLNSVALSRAGISTIQQNQLEIWYLEQYRTHTKTVSDESCAGKWFNGDLADFDVWRSRQKRVRPLGAFASAGGSYNVKVEESGGGESISESVTCSIAGDESKSRLSGPETGLELVTVPDPIVRASSPSTTASTPASLSASASIYAPTSTSTPSAEISTTKHVSNGSKGTQTYVINDEIIRVRGMDCIKAPKSNGNDCNNTPLIWPVVLHNVTDFSISEGRSRYQICVDKSQPFVLVVSAMGLGLKTLSACVAVATELVTTLPDATIWWFNDFKVHPSVCAGLDSFFRSCGGPRRCVRVAMSLRQTDPVDVADTIGSSSLPRCVLLRNVLKGCEPPPQLMSECSITAFVSHDEQSDLHAAGEEEDDIEFAVPCWRLYSQEKSVDPSHSSLKLTNGFGATNTKSPNRAGTCHVVIGGTGGLGRVLVKQLLNEASASDLMSVTVVTRQLARKEKCGETNMGFDKRVCVLPFKRFTNSVSKFLAAEVSSLRTREAMMLNAHSNSKQQTPKQQAQQSEMNVVIWQLAGGIWDCSLVGLPKIEVRNKLKALNAAKADLSDSITKAVLLNAQQNLPLDLGNLVTLAQVSSLSAVLPFGPSASLYASANGALHGIAQAGAALSTTVLSKNGNKSKSSKAGKSKKEENQHDASAVNEDATGRVVNGNAKRNNSSTNADVDVEDKSQENLNNVGQTRLRVITVALGHVHDVGMLADQFHKGSAAVGASSTSAKSDVSCDKIDSNTAVVAVPSDASKITWADKLRMNKSNTRTNIVTTNGSIGKGERLIERETEEEKEGLDERLRMLGVKAMTAQDAVSGLVMLYRDSSFGVMIQRETEIETNSQIQSVSRDNGLAVIADLDWKQLRLVFGDRVRCLHDQIVDDNQSDEINSNDNSSDIAGNDNVTETTPASENNSTIVTNWSSTSSNNGSNSKSSNESNALGVRASPTADEMSAAYLKIVRVVWQCVRDVLGEALGMDAELLQTQWEFLGLSSFKLIQLRARLMAVLGRNDLPPTLMFQCRTAEAVATYLRDS